MKTITETRVEIDVLRPNGMTETKDLYPRFIRLNDHLFSQIQKATRDAGRGKVLQYRNIESVVEIEESDYHEGCSRCKKDVDTRTAYTQMEWRRFGGTKVQVKIPYCDNCQSLLSNIGAGEITDLEHRAGNVPSYEPDGKEDF
ncbi:MAG: hypothetical protein ABIG69_07910 [Bacteroidota bacterium]